MQRVLIRIDGLCFDVRRAAFPLCVVGGGGDLAAAFDEDVSLETVSFALSYVEVYIYQTDAGACIYMHVCMSTYLQRVLPREALIAMLAGKRLDGQMNALMALEIVIPVEALGALIAFEGAVVGGGLLVVRGPQEVRHCGCGAAVDGHHARVHAADEGHLAVWIVDVGVHGAGLGDEAAVRALVLVRMR